MNVTIIGTGFVGVVSAAVYASFGNQVAGLDIDPQKVANLNQGQVPFYEPNLESLLKEQLTTGRLTFTTDYAAAIPQADVIMVAVGTPSAADGQADLKFVFAACESMAPHLKAGAIVVIKSTVPPGTLKEVEKVLQPKATVPFSLASVPEFLREGSAVADTLSPDRVILGATDDKVFSVLEELHQPLNAPILRVSPESAQMAKYAANSYLATRITFANQIADLCEKNGADIQEVVKAIGYDERIGNHYWYPGFGYGGSCFPKDVKELAAYSRAVGEGNNLFNKINELNENRIPRLLDQFGEVMGGWTGKKVAVLGIAFKPNTDDLREAPSLKIVPYLLEHSATAIGFDPRAVWPQAPQGYTQVSSIEEATKEADVIIATIEWPEIVNFDFSHVRSQTKDQWFIDARNQFPAETMEQLGFKYLSIGRIDKVQKHD